MSAVSRVGTVIVPVRDQERALAFYRDALDAMPRPTTQRCSRAATTSTPT
jgi:hypothetical protein